MGIPKPKWNNKAKGLSESLKPERRIRGKRKMESITFVARIPVKKLKSAPVKLWA